MIQLDTFRNAASAVSSAMQNEVAVSLDRTGKSLTLNALDGTPRNVKPLTDTTDIQRNIVVRSELLSALRGEVGVSSAARKFIDRMASQLLGDGAESQVKLAQTPLSMREVRQILQKVDTFKAGQAFASVKNEFKATPTMSRRTAEAPELGSAPKLAEHAIEEAKEAPVRADYEAKVAKAKVANEAARAEFRSQVEGQLNLFSKTISQLNKMRRGSDECDSGVGSGVRFKLDQAWDTVAKHADAMMTGRPHPAGLKALSDFVSAFVFSAQVACERGYGMQQGDRGTAILEMDIPKYKEPAEEAPAEAMPEMPVFEKEDLALSDADRAKAAKMTPQRQMKEIDSIEAERAKTDKALAAKREAAAQAAAEKAKAEAAEAAAKLAAEAKLAELKAAARLDAKNVRALSAKANLFGMTVQNKVSDFLGRIKGAAEGEQKAIDRLATEAKASITRHLQTRYLDAVEHDAYNNKMGEPSQEAAAIEKEMDKALEKELLSQIKFMHGVYSELNGVMASKGKDASFVQLDQLMSFDPVRKQAKLSFGNLEGVLHAMSGQINSKAGKMALANAHGVALTFQPGKGFFASLETQTKVMLSTVNPSLNIPLSIGLSADHKRLELGIKTLTGDNVDVITGFNWAVADLANGALEKANAKPLPEQQASSVFKREAVDPKNKEGVLMEYSIDFAALAKNAGLPEIANVKDFSLDANQNLVFKFA